MPHEQGCFQPQRTGSIQPFQLVVPIPSCPADTPPTTLLTVTNMFDHRVPVNEKGILALWRLRETEIVIRICIFLRSRGLQSFKVSDMFLIRWHWELGKSNRSESQTVDFFDENRCWLIPIDGLFTGSDS